MSADLILKSRCIFDSAGDEPFSGFVAVKGNRIAMVGTDDDDCEVWTGPDTAVYDFGNKLIIPGFHDSHTHLILAGMFKTYANLGSARSEQESARMLRDFESEHPSEGWVFGFNWYHVFWDVKELPRKETLDEYFPDRPVMLLNAEAHGAWVNSRALEIAGITAETPDPFGGEIGRDSDGMPTGFLYESAMSLVTEHAFSFSEEQQRLYLKNFMDTAAELGITSVVDVQPYFGVDLGSPEVYAAMEADGTLNMRITAASNLFGDLDRALENSRKYRSDKVRAHMLKQFVDGVFTTHTALVMDDYEDLPGNNGTPLYQLDAFSEAVCEAHKRGLWVKIHAIGDRAVNFTLNCYERAVETYGSNGCRHAVEHAELVSEEDMERFGRLGIVPSVQPEHIGLMPTWEGEEYRYVLGEERAGRTWSFRSLLDQTGILALGSDCPVVDNNPFLAIHRGSCRLHDDGLPEGGWNPSQKLTVAELIRCYTYGSAYGVGREHELGTLQPGKFADIVVCDRNLFEASHSVIRDAKVDMTIVDGKIVYER